jgi:hypothetical protein
MLIGNSNIEHSRLYKSDCPVEQWALTALNAYDAIRSGKIRARLRSAVMKTTSIEKELMDA